MIITHFFILAKVSHIFIVKLKPITEFVVLNEALKYEFTRHTLFVIKNDDELHIYFLNK